jgi:hypothetical protein
LTGITAAYSLSFKDGKPYIYEVIGGCSDFNAYRTLTTDMLSDVNQMFQVDFITSEPDVKKIGDIAVDRWTVNLEGLMDKLPELIAEAESLKEPGHGEEAESPEEAEQAEEDSEAAEAADLEEIKKMVNALTDGKPCEMFIGYSKELAYLSMSPNGMADLENMIKGDLMDEAPDAAALFGPLDSTSQVMMRLDVSGLMKQLEGVLLKVMPPEELGEYQQAMTLFENVPPFYMGKRFNKDSVRADFYIPRGMLSALLGMADEGESEE